MTVFYDPTEGIATIALKLGQSVIPLVLVRPEFYILLGLNLSFYYSVRVGYFVPEDSHLKLSMPLTMVTGSLMTFFVVFYNGNVFTRYNALYTLTMGIVENTVYVVSLLDREIDNKDLVRRLTRWVIASVVIHFASLTGGLTDEAWLSYRNFGLLRTIEMDHLIDHCKHLGSSALPEFLPMHWSMKIYRRKLPRVPDLDRAFFQVLKNQQDITRIMTLPMPFQYFHLMNLMMLLNLGLWSYTLAMVDSYFAPLIFFFIQLMFQGLRELTIGLSDPFGDDDVDFPLSSWLTGLYRKLFDLLEVNYHIKKDEERAIIPELKLGETVVNFANSVGSNSLLAKWQASRLEGGGME